MLAEIDARQVETSSVRLANGGDAFLARPTTPGPHPTIVLMHERYGLVQHTKDLAIRFAAGGHVADVADQGTDIPGDQISRHAGQAAWRRQGHEPPHSRTLCYQ